MSITITSDNQKRVESMAVCLVAEWHQTTFGQAMDWMNGEFPERHLIPPDEMLATRARWRRLARRALDHMDYLVIEEREEMLDAEIGA